MSQVQEATNDWGKTIESPANQTRIMSEQWERLTRTIGSIFLPIVNKILPYINGILMVMVEIAKVIAQISATLFGFNEEDLDFGAGVGDSMDILGESIDNATDSTEKLKKSMLGLRSFDKIINISTPSSNDSSSSGLGVDPKIANLANRAMDEYNKKLTNVQMKATKIRDNIMEWLGFTKEVDEKTGEVSFKFDHITSGTVLGALAVGGSIYSGTHKIYKIMEKLGILKLPSISSLSKVFTGSNMTNAISIFSKALPIILVVAAEIQAIMTDKDLQKQIEKLKTNFAKLKETLQPLADKIFPKLEKIFKTISDLVGKAALETMNKEWEKFVHFMGTLSELTLNAINADIEILIDLINGDFKSAKEHWVEHWNTMKKSVSDFATEFKDNVGKISVDDVLKNMKKVVDWFDGLPNKAGEKAAEIAEKIPKKIGEFFDKEENQKKLLDIGKKIIGFIISGMTAGITTMVNIPTLIANKIASQLKGDKKEKGSQSFVDIGTNIVKSITQGMVSPIATAIPKFVSSFYDTLAKEFDKQGNSGISIGIKGLKAGFGGSLFDFVFKANGGVYSNGKWNNIARYDGGGMPESGQLFWARENGLPEMVGQIGGHTAVMNNGQIVGSVANGVYKAVLSANAQSHSNNNNSIINIYLDKNKKLATYTLNELQNMAKSNGKPIELS